MKEGGQKKVLHTTGSIEKPITGLDGVVHNVSGLVVLHLPQAEANLGHLVAIVQVDTGNVDHDCYVPLEEFFPGGVLKRSIGSSVRIEGRKAKMIS